MGLEIVKNTQYGVDINYWTVNKTNVDWANKIANIRVDGYKDKSIKDNDKKPITSIEYCFEEKTNIDGTILEQFPFKPEDNVVAKSYELIKTKPEFVGALDIMEIK